MNTKHTPGPWKVEQRFSGNRFIHSDNRQSPICGVSFVGMGIDVDESKANADLIAAAPKMFDLLVELIDMEGPQPGNSGWANRVKSLISEVAGD